MTYVELAVLQRRFLYPSRARQWVRVFNKINVNPAAQATFHPTWYGAKAVVWLSKECSS